MLWVGLAAIILGPAGAAWVGTKTAMNSLKASFKDFREEIRRDHDETRGWVRSIQEQANLNTNRISVMEALDEMKRVEEGRKGE